MGIKWSGSTPARYTSPAECRRSRRYPSALQYLDRLDYLAAERNYDAYMRAAGRLRRGMAYDALGRRDEAMSCYQEVLALGTGGDVRDRAREFLNRPFAG